MDTDSMPLAWSRSFSVRLSACPLYEEHYPLHRVIEAEDSTDLKIFCTDDPGLFVHDITGKQ